MTTEIQNTLWKINSNGYYPYCPKCRYEPYDGRLTNFCPECGADLRGKNNIVTKDSRQIVKDLRQKSKGYKDEELLLLAADKIQYLQKIVDERGDSNV